MRTNRNEANNVGATPSPRSKTLVLLPVAAAVACVAVFGVWLTLEQRVEIERRVPDVRPTPSLARGAPLNPGTTTPGDAAPSSHPGSWPQFRGARRDAVASSSAAIARRWPAQGPPVLWRIPVGEGYAGAAIHSGRAYLIDYDRDRGEDAIRCLSLDTGREIWRYSYSVEVKRNHGMSRTVPAVNNRFVVALGPKCHASCLDAVTGELVWKKNLVREYGTEVPPWYAGQCPLIESDRVVLAPGAKPLMTAIDLATGKEIWRTAELDGWGMTHSSILPIEFEGERQYVYCAGKGAAGVSARDGRVLWTLPQWTIPIANIAMPVWIPPDRLFFSGGYDSGSMMARLEQSGTARAPVSNESREQDEDARRGAPTILFRLEPKVFGAEQHTPVLYDGHIYGVEPKPVTALVCLDLDGNRLWSSAPAARFGLGPFMIVDGLILALDEEGTLHLAEASPRGYVELARAKLLHGHDARGPLAFAEGRLILRDLTEMICVDLTRAP